MTVPPQLNDCAIPALKKRMGLSWLVIAPFIKAIITALLPIIIDWFANLDPSEQMTYVRMAATDIKAP